MKEIALRDKVGKKKQKWKTNGTSRSKEIFTRKRGGGSNCIFQGRNTEKRKNLKIYS